MNVVTDFEATLMTKSSGHSITLKFNGHPDENINGLNDQQFHVIISMLKSGKTVKSNGTVIELS